MSQCQNVLCGLVQGHEGSHLCKRHCRKIWQDARSGRLYCGRGCGEVEDESLGVLESLSKRVEKLSAQQDDQVVELRAANRAVDDLFKEFGARWKADLLKAMAQSHSEWAAELEKKQVLEIKELSERTIRLRQALNDQVRWRNTVDDRFNELRMPLGDAVRKIIAQRVSMLARRIWADIPF